MLTDATAPLEEVAAALGLGPDKLKRRHRDLHAARGFPLPVPGGGWRWSRRAVATWIDGAGSAAVLPAAAAAPADEAVAVDVHAADARAVAGVVLEQHRALRARYGGQR